MSPNAVLYHPTVSQGLPGQHSRGSDLSDPAWLGANSDRPEVQDLIREAIHRGKIRVRPVLGDPDRVKVLPDPPLKPAAVWE